ncbi:hypothetical protein PSEUBRA_000592 [Kalmanozyma brasiliensis GHG001]|nr:uncharacterized protein PSEUBRA_000592 [Kalmanozyma brasiliensis GHG001]EST10179.2 hypothetical protein PSEUBRA_000592 [Kalmanozyma brasiliensis GHG001]
MTGTAHILPISDLVHSRDVGSKLRLAGIVTAVNPTNASLIVLSDPFPSPNSDPGSLLVDLSLCTDQSGTTGAGWHKSHPQLVPPPLKGMIMVIGHLIRREVAIDIDFLHNQTQRGWDGVQTNDALPHFENDEWDLPNRFFVLEAILIKPLDHTFDLRLWNHTARLRSQHEWQMHHLDAPSTDKKGKRKALD